MPGIGLLAVDARRCAMACAVGYAAILRAIEEIDYDTFGTRARVGRMARVRLLWRAGGSPLWARGVPPRGSMAGPRFSAQPPPPAPGSDPLPSTPPTPSHS